MLWRCSSRLRQTANNSLFKSFQRRVQAPRFRWHNYKQSSTWTRHGLPKKNLQQFGLSRANMSVGFASDPRGKVVISVGLAACLIGGIGYIKYSQQQTSSGPYLVNKIIEHANRTSVVQETVGRPVVLEGFIKSAPAKSAEGQEMSFHVRGPGGSAGDRVKLHACGQMIEGRWAQHSAHVELPDGVCIAIPAQPDLEPLGDEALVLDKPNYILMVAVALGLGIGIAVVLNRILHRRADAAGTLPDAVFALARQNVAESPAVIRALGSPISCKTSYRLSGDKPQVSSDFARFSFDISGPEGSAVAQLQAVRDTDESWRHTHLSVELPGLQKIVLPTEAGGETFLKTNSHNARSSSKKRKNKSRKKKRK